jgi:acetyl-CoA C-acetyltransferase
MGEAFIVTAVRTAGGRKGGRLSGWHPVDLGGAVIDAVLDRTGADPALIDDVIMGCVSQVGEQAINVARNAVLSSRLPESVPGTSVDRQCGSSQQALHFAAQAVKAGDMDIVIASGVESMTRVPMGSSAVLALKAGMGSYMSPKLQEKYPGIQFSQFEGAEMVATKYQLTKDQLDAYAYESHRRAKAATEGKKFNDEIVPLEITTADGKTETHLVDEGIRFDASLDAIRGVKLLKEGGALTAATSSQICDGASAVLVVNEAGLRKLGLDPIAHIRHLTVVGGDPVIMLEAPLPASELALKKAGMSADDIDLFEVNEAFASVPVAYMQRLGVPHEKLNVHGGAIALGHPLGASGAKLMATLLNALKTRGGRFGLQTMCEGGGLANVTIVERL